MSRSVSYSPQLDGLRALCIVFTIANHAEGVPQWINGSVGVDVFFALSGFLITGILLGRDVSLRAFYIRRICRIMPVYYFAFGLTALSAFVLAKVSGGQKVQELQASWAWILAFCGEYRPEQAGSFFGHSWTIGIEEKFYVLWPVLFLLVLRKTKLVFLFLACVPVVMAFLGEFELRGYGGIALGSIASLLYFRFRVPTAPAAVGVLLCVAAYLVLGLLHWSNLLMAAAAAVLIPSLYDRNGAATARALAHPWLVWAGKLTFSVYMLHVLCANTVKIVLPKVGVTWWAAAYLATYALSLAAAWVVYRLLEKPMINLGRRLADSPPSMPRSTAPLA